MTMNKEVLIEIIENIKESADELTQIEEKNDVEFSRKGDFKT